MLCCSGWQVMPRLLHSTRVLITSMHWQARLSAQDLH